MIIKFPQTGYKLDTLNPSEDFEERIKEVFATFTEETSEEYTFADKLYFLDLLRTYIHGDIDDEDLVKDVILNYAEYELTEYGSLPDKDNYQTIEFMTECARQGFRPFGIRKAEKSSSMNDKTQKTILRVIQIIVNWERDEQKHE